jgi:hypothetical protein
VSEPGAEHEIVDEHLLHRFLDEDVLNGLKDVGARGAPPEKCRGLGAACVEALVKTLRKTPKSLTCRYTLGRTPGECKSRRR